MSDTSCAVCSEPVGSCWSTVDGIIYCIPCSPKPKRFHVDFWIGNRHVYAGDFLNMRSVERVRNYLHTQHDCDIDITIAKNLDIEALDNV